MKNFSIWKNYNNIKEYSELKENKEVDVLIIGGGITGISTLYNLKNSNLKVMLVEQNKIGMGITANSTGKLNFLQNDLLDKIRSFYNDDIASLYLESQIKTINDIVSTIKKENIDCDLEKTDAYLYTNKDTEINKLKNLEMFLKTNNIKVFKSKNKLVKSKYMIKVKDTYTYNPLKFIEGLLNNDKYPIYEKTSIKDIQYKDNYYFSYTDKYIIKSKYVILASHYPYFLKPFIFPIKVSLEKSYLSASLFKTSPVSLISYSNPTISIRNYKNYLVYLSNSHTISKNICAKDNFNELLKKIKDINLNSEYLWSNIDIITSDGLPYIGRLNNNLLIGTGYNTWGLTNGFLAGKIISDIILKNNNRYINLFSPTRKDIKHIFTYLKNTYDNVERFIKSYLNSKSTKYNCPHLGCKLIYNEIEETFDCPSHGSRFKKDGTCINGPANKGINID